MYEWRKSSHSSQAQGNCVEVAALPAGGRAVRDSKDPGGSHLVFDGPAWREFVADLKGAPEPA
jgi:hypothetical protein